MAQATGQTGIRNRGGKPHSLNRERKKVDLLPMIFQQEGKEVRLPCQGIRVLGLDLGTTNSTVAELEWSPEPGALPRCHCLEIPQSVPEGGVYTHLLVPSVVALYQGRLWVGEGAKRLRARASELKLVPNRDLFFECKNDMGIKKTYHKAPEGYRSAADISAHILRFLRQAAQTEASRPPDRLVVTVPASFQAAQRLDTLKAAELAGINLSSGDLLDEPVAAFLDFLVTQGRDLLPALTTPKNLLVFDFGGGTCDVALFRLWSAREGLQAEWLAVSRYHRLGGGDLDAAIVHEVLIPQVVAQQGWSPLDLSYEEKKRYLEPAYLELAETLKINLSREISRLQQFNKYETADKTQILVRQPGAYPCQLPTRQVTLQAPILRASDFEALLAPFLDQEFLYARETEYRLTCSIFAPITDALDRGGLTPEEVDYCLAVGGSSLLPQVLASLQQFLPRARLLTYPGSGVLQTAIARGAAYHALTLALFGRGLLQPISHDRLAILAASGPVELVPRGQPLPYPATGLAKSEVLAVPETSLQHSLALRVEVVGGEGDQERTLFQSVWEIPAPVNKGEPLLLEYCYDDNQILTLILKMAKAPAVTPFAAQIDKPFTNVVNPWADKMVIEEMEEDLRTGKISREKIPEVMVKLAQRYADLGQREKAIDYLKRVLRFKNRPDAGILNLIALYYGELGDRKREEKYYREAGQASSWSGPWFNLALSLFKQERLEEAGEAVEKAWQREQLPPYLVLKARIAAKSGKAAAAADLLQQAVKAFDPIPELSDWELGWLLSAAQLLEDQNLIRQVKAEQQKRQQRESEATPSGMLPIITQAMVKGAS